MKYSVILFTFFTALSSLYAQGSDFATIDIGKNEQIGADHLGFGSGRTVGGAG